MAVFMDKHPLYRLLKTDFSHLLENAVINNQCLFLPDIRNIKDTDIREHFFESHILKKDKSKSGYWTSQDESVIVEEKSGVLRLVFGPGYQPSFCQGLHTTIILSSVVSEDNLRVFSVDKPLLPFYLKMEEIYSRPKSANIHRNMKIDKASKRPSSVPSFQRTDSRKLTRMTSASSRCSQREAKGPTPRQLSADSGVELESYLYDLPPRITSYDESEAFILDQTNHRQFIIDLHRRVAPVKRELNQMNVASGPSTEDITLLSASLRNIVSDSISAFSSNGYLKSPRYQDLIQSSIENIVMQLVQDQLWPGVKSLFGKEDKAMHKKLSILWVNGFRCIDNSFDQDFLLPYPAALVELAALDMRSTPLDMLTCLHDAVEQVKTQIKTSISDEKFLNETSDKKLTLEAILTSILVQARPLHLHSCLFYIKHFIFSPHTELQNSFDLIKSSVQYLERQDLDHIKYNQSHLWMKEIKLKDLNIFTNFLEDETTQLSHTDIFKQNVARQLEMASREYTVHQEDEWSKLSEDLQTKVISNTTFLQQIQSRLICSSKLEKIG